MKLREYMDLVKGIAVTVYGYHWTSKWREDIKYRCSGLVDYHERILDLERNSVQRAYSDERFKELEWRIRKLEHDMEQHDE